MLSVSSIGSASGAADYYGKDDYYVTGEADTPGLEWGGKGAEKVGLTGKASPWDFKAILEGNHEVFKGPGRPEAQADRNHRAGWDLTFSAPKSVSLAILVGKDDRLDKAHDKAVNTAMAYAEKHFAITRVRDQGKIKEVQTGNLLYAQTIHGTSRSGDPQRHTHVVIANATVETSTGRVRALETLQLFKHSNLVGRIYQAELAKEAIRLGFDVTRNPKGGTFELSAYGRDQVEHFSKRNSQIRAAIEIETKRNGGPLTAAQRETIVLKNRPKKLDTQRKELVEKWEKEATVVGLDAFAMSREAIGKSDPGRDLTPQASGTVDDKLSRMRAALAAVFGRQQVRDPYGASRVRGAHDGDARAAVSLGLQIHEQGRAVFTRHDIVQSALKHSKAGMTLARLEAVLERLEAEGRLKSADVRLRGGITTDRALALERRIVSTLNAGRNSIDPIYNREKANAALDAVAHREGEIILNEGQREAAHKLLTSTDRIVGIQGSAGVGKTTMFSVVRELAEAKGKKIMGLAPTHAAVRELASGADIRSQTIESFVQTAEKVMSQGIGGKESVGLKNLRAAHTGKSLLVDEASMMSNLGADRLFRVATALQIERIILIGDERQLGSPEAGAPFRLLLEEKMDHARMTEIRRQKDPEIKAAVTAMAKGTPVQGLSALGSRVVEAGKDATDTRLAAEAFDAWKTVRDAGGSASIIVPTHALRNRISRLVREDMAGRGELTGQSVTANTLSHVRMSTAESYKAASYSEGQVLVFHAGMKSTGIAKGDQLVITGRDERNEALHVLSGDRQVTIDLNALAVSRKSKFQAYRAVETEIQAGDRLVWERRDDQRPFIQTGNSLTVLEAGSKEWRIQTADGVERMLSATDPALRFLSHAYAMTADRSQGSTHHNVIAVLSSKHGEGANQARAYVQASRTAETLTFVTNDSRLLGMRLSDQTGQNAIACHELASITKDMADKPLLGLQAEVTPEKSDSAIDQKQNDHLDRVAFSDPDKPPKKEAEKEKFFEKTQDLAQLGMSL